jgi:hypothetical protein
MSTCADIQLILFNHYLRSDIIICPNTEAIGAEADLLIIQPSGLVMEIEIKVSRADFKADFRKLAKHAGLQGGGRTSVRRAAGPNYFSFAVPAGLVKPEEVPAYCGLIYIHGLGEQQPYERAEIMRNAPRLHAGKCDEKTMRRVARSLMYKVFNAYRYDLPEHANLAFQPAEQEVIHG